MIIKIILFTIFVLVAVFAVSLLKKSKNKIKKED